MNAWTTLTIVAKMPPAPTPKSLSTVVANQGTLEMATTVQVGSWNSRLASVSFQTFGSVQLGLTFSNVLLEIEVNYRKLLLALFIIISFICSVIIYLLIQS